MTELAAIAEEKGIKFFLISFTDILGVQRAKLVPTRAIADMAVEGAGFAGFAAWLDMSPADADILAIPDADSLIRLPWKPEVGWLAADVHYKGDPFANAPRVVLQEVLACPRNRPEFVSLLNNDAVPEPGWLAALVTKAESSGAGAVASKMIRHDNRDRLDNAGHVFLNTGEILPRGAGQSPDDYIKPASVAGVCGGACLLRSSMLDDIGMFDEFFSTGYEDAELGLRALLAGYEQIFAPKAVVRHRIGASIDKIRDLSYAVQLQVNINYTYVKLVPWPVAVWNLPWILLKTVALLILPLLMGRWRLLKVQWRAFGRTMRFLPTMFRARRRFKKRRVSSSVVIGRQKFFARLYAGYFRRFVIGGKPTIFER